MAPPATTHKYLWETTKQPHSVLEQLLNTMLLLSTNETADKLKGTIVPSSTNYKCSNKTNFQGIIKEGLQEDKGKT